MHFNIRLTGPALLIAVGLTASGAWYFHPWVHAPPEAHPSGTTVITLEGPAFISTVGGQLGVATFSTTERFISKNHQMFMGVELPVGVTESYFQAAVTYRYHIEMEKKWPISIDGKTCVVHAGTIKPTIPVAFNTATIQKYTTSGWARFDKTENLEALERSITAQLEARARSAQYEQIVKDAARVNVQAFVSTWLLKANQWGREPEYKVVVLFPGETLQSQRAAIMDKTHH